MKLLCAICLMLSIGSYAQQEPVSYEWEDLKILVHDPDTIESISFRKMKLDQLPEELYTYKNLRILDLSKNNLTKLPDSISSLKKLETINLERNKLDIFPIQFCRMRSLRSINLGLNTIGNLPACIEGLKDLEELYLYDNPIKVLPEGLTNLKHLKYLDLSGIRFSPEFQKIWIERLQDVKVDFDSPCDCMK